MRSCEIMPASLYMPTKNQASCWLHWSHAMNLTASNIGSPWPQCLLTPGCPPFGVVPMLPHTDAEPARLSTKRTKPQRAVQDLGDLSPLASSWAGC